MYPLKLSVTLKYKTWVTDSNSADVQPHRNLGPLCDDGGVHLHDSCAGLDIRNC